MIPDTLYKIQLWTNEKPASEMEPSDWSKVGSYKGCPQQNKALYRHEHIGQQYYWKQYIGPFLTKNAIVLLVLVLVHLKL